MCISVCLPHISRQESPRDSSLPFHPGHSHQSTTPILTLASVVEIVPPCVWFCLVCFCHHFPPSWLIYVPLYIQQCRQITLLLLVSWWLFLRLIRFLWSCMTVLLWFFDYCIEIKELMMIATEHLRFWSSCGLFLFCSIFKKQARLPVAGPGQKMSYCSLN